MHLYVLSGSDTHKNLGRKTEEGWSIYKADELGIGDDDEGGGESSNFTASFS